jgi:hypothetical protein
MTKPVITNRVTQGTALTYQQLDTNFSNLQNATFGVTDGTNSHDFNLNDRITFTAGTNMSLGVNASTGAITVTNTYSYTLPTATTTQLGGVKVDGTTITINGSGVISSSGGGGVPVVSNYYTLGSTGNGNFGLKVNSTYGSSIALIAGSETPNSGGANIAFIQSSNYTDLAIQTTLNGGYKSGITLAGNGSALVNIYPALTVTGQVWPTSYREQSTTKSFVSTFTPDATEASIQIMTLTGNITINGFNTGNVAYGQSVTLLLIQDSTGSRTLTSGMKFAGGSKALSTSPGAIDVLYITYINGYYLASLVKGFV